MGVRVPPSAQALQFGTTPLIAEVKKLAIEQECSGLFWITKESNTLTRKLYDKVAVAGDLVRYEIKLED